MNISRSISGLAIFAAMWLGLVPGAAFVEIGTAHAADMASESRELPPFSRIDARGSFELRITAGGEQNVQIEATERDLKRVKTEVRDETLVLSYKERWFSFLFDDERIVTISLPELRGMELSGAGEIIVVGIESDAFDLSINGAADITLKGTCGSLEFDMNGAGDVMARSLECATVEALINGVGSAELYASESVDAVLNGVGSITVYGHPEEVSKEINGFGSFDIDE